MLLKTRQHLLEKEGFSVVSAEGFTEALERCHAGQFDMVVMGHSIPHKDKEALFRVVREKCPVPVIALLRGGEPPLSGAAESVDPMDPRRFIEVVHRVATKDSETSS
jgi:CheY-like chemotaxis protein